MKWIFAVIGLAAITLSCSATWAAQEAHLSAGSPGTWHLIGTTHAGHSADHDSIIVNGPGDAFRRIKFRVRDATLNLRRLVVSYDNGASQNVETRNDIPKGGESRVIDLNGGKRQLRRIDFWYDTKGFLSGTADVTVYGMK